MHIIQIICWLSLTLLAAPEKKEVLQYEVIGKGKPVGELTITREINGPKTRYRSLNKTKVSLLKTFRIRHELEAIFENGELVYSEVTVEVNDNVHNHTRIERDGQQYRVYSEGKQINTISRPVHFTAIHLYFQEPTDQSEVFSEQEAIWQPIRRSEEASFDYLLDKKGKANLYRYEDGRMIYAELGHWLMSTELRLIES